MKNGFHFIFEKYKQRNFYGWLRYGIAETWYDIEAATKFLKEHIND